MTTRRIPQLDEVAVPVRREAQRCPAPTNVIITRLDGKVMRYWTDGSLRHAPGAETEVTTPITYEPEGT